METRARVNLIIDAVMLLCLSSMAGLGLLMKYALPPGREVRDRYGDVTLVWLGMDRHQWGVVHFILGCALVVLVAVHIALHWQAIVCICRSLIGSSAARVILAAVLVLVVLATMLFAFFITPEEHTRGRGEGRGFRGGRGALEMRELDTTR